MIEVLADKPYRGVTTGSNKAFDLDQQAYESLAKKSASVDIIKPLLYGDDLHPWYHENSSHWLIFAKRNIDIDAYPSVKKHLQQYREQLEPKPTGWEPKSDADEDKWPGRKAGNYKWYEIQDSVEYYPAFEKPRIHSTKVSKYPSFSLWEPTAYAGNTSYVLPIPDLETGYYLLGLLNSRVCEYFSRSVFAAKANGYYEVQPEPLGRFPVPNATDAEREAIGTLAQEITTEAQARYARHEKVRHRLQADFGSPGVRLNQKLTAWWTLDFAALQAELGKVFKKTIPVKERDEWEEWFGEQCAAHRQHTDAMVARETALNARVYALFTLAPAEIALIEAATKYQYGEV